MSADESASATDQSGPGGSGRDDGSVGDGAAPEREPERAGRVRRAVDYVLLAGLLLVGLVAVVSLYLSASQVTTDWVAPAYRSLFRTAFNLVVVLLVGAGLVVQLRRLR